MLTKKIHITTQDFSSAELTSYLETELPPNTTLQPKSGAMTSRAVDPTVTALITAGISVVGTLATTILQMYKIHKETDQVSVHIKRLDGVEISFPAGTSAKEIQGYFAMAESEGIQVDSLHFERH